MSTIEVRDAVADDALAIADAHVTAWQVGYRHLIPDEVLDDPAMRAARESAWVRQLASGSDADRDTRVFAALLDGRVVGFGHTGPEADPPDDLAGGPRGEVYGFYVHPDAWGSGVAASLMTSCLDELRSRGLSEAVLWTLRENPRARGFYEKAGWIATGRQDRWHGPKSTGIALRSSLVIVMYRIAIGRRSGRV